MIAGPVHTRVARSDVEPAPRGQHEEAIYRKTNRDPEGSHNGSIDQYAENHCYFQADFFGQLMLYLVPIGQVMLYCTICDQKRSLRTRTVYALFPGQLTINGTLITFLRSGLCLSRNRTSRNRRWIDIGSFRQHRAALRNRPIKHLAR